MTAHTDSGIVMAMRHRELPIHGVQFHPESVLTQGGHRMLANWLTVCGDAPQDSLVDTLEAEVAEALGRSPCEWLTSAETPQPLTGGGAAYRGMPSVPTPTDTTASLAISDPGGCC